MTRNRIADIRSERGLSQEELAVRAGTTQATISRLEKGDRGLDEDWLHKIADALKCSMSELLRDAASKLSHIDDKGQALMVDVSDKSVSSRSARAEGFVAMKPETLALVEQGDAKKGDVLATARIAGIMAAKKTHELIPLCHPLAITKASVNFTASKNPAGLHVTADVKVSGQTGVEMEALTAVSVACLTLYDMLKAADKGMTISNIRLLEKTGGRSGTFRAGE